MERGRIPQELKNCLIYIHTMNFNTYRLEIYNQYKNIFEMQTDKFEWQLFSS